MAKFIKEIFKNDNFSLSECSDGFYLYDYIREMNIAMRAKNEQEAYIEALIYYQKRLSILEYNHRDLQKKVQAFISQFVDENENEIKF